MYTKVEFQPDPNHCANPLRLDDAISAVLQQEIDELEATPLPTRIALLLSRHASERKCRAPGSSGNVFETRRLSRLTEEGTEQSGAMPLVFFSPTDLAAG